MNQGLGDSVELCQCKNVNILNNVFSEFAKFASELLVPLSHKAVGHSVLGFHHRGPHACVHLGFLWADVDGSVSCRLDALVLHRCVWNVWKQCFFPPLSGSVPDRHTKIQLMAQGGYRRPHICMADYSQLPLPTTVPTHTHTKYLYTPRLAIFTFSNRNWGLCACVRACGLYIYLNPNLHVAYLTVSLLCYVSRRVPILTWHAVWQRSTRRGWTGVQLMSTRQQSGWSMDFSSIITHLLTFQAGSI